MKKYLANTTIGISVTLRNGGNVRVSFSPLSDGTSIFYTDDRELQYALEHHYKYGKLFNIVGEINKEISSITKKDTRSKEKKPSGTSKKSKSQTEQLLPIDETKDSPISNNNESEEDQDEEPTTPEPREVIVTDIDAAKDYLAENYDIVRTKLKTEEIINETALSLGILFKYL